MNCQLSPEAPKRRRIEVAFYFDLVCPWCLIGKRQLERAIDLLALGYADVDVVVQWKSLPLLPDMPSGGVPFQAFYLKRLGSATAVAVRRRQIREAGLAAGVEFDFERITLMPNTIAAHRLIEYAGQSGGQALQAQLIDRLFDAFFCRNEDIGDLQVLARIGEAFGLERTTTLALLASPAHETPLQLWQDDARRQDIAGVPGFVLNDRAPRFGAHPPEQLAQALLASLPA
ncbi:DsbA family oxidoreductase [Dyella soli]|uniref:DsbA family oxidoreductase n=1 Tax=Dyella soli TaxID=522319 RepID=A0A4R0YMT6_9GAMM|nr:DsbA family oxidoreductase [Dyella soli]TCI10207.1 DsbA family oxidoreductase [Dyella soli]